MQKVSTFLVSLLSLAGFLISEGMSASGVLAAQEQGGPERRDERSQQNEPTGSRRGPGGSGGPIELGPDDKQTYPDPPDSIVARRDDIQHGKLEMIEYDSKTVGTTRKMNVYTPPGYTTDQKYPVL